MGLTKLRGLQVKSNSLTSDNIKDHTINSLDIAAASLSGGVFISGSIPAEKIDIESLAGVGLIFNEETGRLDAVNSETTNASLLVTGTLDDARLSANVTLFGNTFNGASELVQLLPDGKLPALDGSNLTGIFSVTFVDLVSPDGVVDGSNMLFTLPGTPASGSLHLYVNGILQRGGEGNDYTISAASVTFSSAPSEGSCILASYRL